MVATCSMTHSLSKRLLELAPRASARAVVRDIKKVPDTPGVYGWWFDCQIADVPRRGTLRKGRWWLAYVGIAPSSARAVALGRRTLQDRIKNHCRGPSGSSTLRRSLACLLAHDLALRTVNPGGRIVLCGPAEDRLSDWMQRHAKLGWITCAKPWDVERQLLNGSVFLPLNIRGATHGFVLELKRRRSQFRHAV